MSIESDIETVEVMIRLYCRKKHRVEELCDDCSELLEYARARLSKCQFGDDKPVCRNCTVHCYNKAMRAKITAVMRFAGPRMLLHHPIQVLRHGMSVKRS
jgi:aerobic-type carbon monoxide dehydrogenase small subunit (CoxS/CutS family)